jgi:hypothetical protein
MPQVLKHPPVEVARPDGGRPFHYRFLISAVRLVVILAISAGIGGGWYLARKGFGRQWRLRVVEELHRRGVEASIRRLTLDPFRGLIAQDVRIFDYKNRERTLAIVSEIALDINYAALFHHEPFLNALDVQNAQITLPVGETGEKIEQPLLKNFRAHVYFPPERIYVSQAEGNFCGFRISATGELIKRENYQVAGGLSPEEWQKRLSIFRKTAAQMRKFTAPGTPPSLQVKFSGDLAQMEDAQVEATLQGEQLDRGPYRIRDLFAAAEWRNQTLNISRCEWEDNLGNFAGRGTWSREHQSGEFQARSTLDLKKLLEAIGWGQQLTDVAFHSPPEIELRGDADLSGREPRVKIIGHGRVERLSYKSVPFSDCGLEFSWDGERAFIRDIHLRQDTGQLRAEILDAPNDFRLNIDSNISPVILRAFASPELNEFLNEWEFAGGAAVRLAIRGQDRHARNWRGDGTIALDLARFRGVWMKNASAKVHFGNGAVAYQDFRVTREEGVATGSFTYDFANHEVRVANIKSSLRPTDAAFWIDPDLSKTVAPYRFRQPPTVTANGVYQFRGGKNTRLDINVDGRGGMDYTFLGKVLPFDHLSAKLVLTTDRLQIVDLAGSLLSGEVRGNTDVSLVRNDPRYHASLTVNGINFPRLTDLYYNYKTAQGNLSGAYNFDGFGSEPRKMRGAGNVEVRDGDVFAIPVFGPLSGILGGIFGRLMPATGYSIAHRATATFTIKDGVIHTEDFEVAGNLFSMLGRGDIHFLDDKLDFDLRINPKGPTAMLAPVYRLFEYKGEGSLKQPNWHPKGF